jgi:DNA-binding LacI/PurR family transcriptional regulator
MKPGKPTMSDVARLAGVSPATVARVLYGNGYVKADKRLLVETAIKDSGYRPNVMARALRTARSFTLGMMVSESPLNAFHAHVAQEVQREALKRGYTVVTINNHVGIVENTGVKRFMDQHVDAIIFCVAMDPLNVRLAAEAGIPIVQIEREVARIGHLVLTDANQGMGEAVNHLKALGHSRIAFIGGSFHIRPAERPPEESVEAQRVDAFRNAMLAAALPFDSNIVLLGPYNWEENRPSPGYRHMEKLLAMQNRPTAVIAGSDILAAGALQAINEAGLKVPDDISVIGYDNVTAEVLTPPLTSIAQPFPQLGRGAVRLALEAIESTVAPAQTDIYPTHLVVRSSTAAPRGKRAA